MRTKHADSSGPRFVRHFGPVLDTLRELGGSSLQPIVLEDLQDDELRVIAELVEVLG